ncbi:MAG TPA: SpoIID/LytB domain-containing protein [Bryobacteraceae bacterium]|nr:SpoIID/LytB domain-containing protein [Bryobacteraceae bacterium]
MTRPALFILFVAIPFCAASPTVKVRVETARGAAVLDLPLERYVAGVLAGESSTFRSDAALRAMAVAVRTYAVRMRGRHAAEGYDFCSTTHCQRVDLEGITPRLASIAEETAGELVWFEGKPALTLYTRDCGGRTEAGVEPYLKGHPDAYCTRAGAGRWQWSGDPAGIAQALLASGLRTPRPVEGIAIVSRTDSGRALTLSLEGAGESVPISAGSFRFAIGRALGWNTVRSDLYEIQSAGGRLLFQGRGSGHGVGLCQRGAEQMGAEGRTDRDILAFYYPGTAVGVTARGLAWQRLGGDTVALWITQPDRDASVLDIAERESRIVTGRTGWPLPARVEIRIYPDLDSFRNATGEPGWVAAFTEGRRIQLQPAFVLRSRGVLDETVRHELFHVAVESRAAPGSPVWFREGIVEYLSGSRAGGDTGTSPAEASARRAHADAARAVAGLVKHYGEAAVLGWVERGLPPEVRNSSVSQPATKSR